MLNHIKKIFAWILVAVTALGTVGTFIVKWDDIMEVYCKYVDRDEHIIQYTKDLFSNPNKANLQVKILPNSNFKLGENMQMRFLSKKEGQLLVFDINSQGALTLLMPNQYYNEEFKLEANKEFIIPEKHWKFDLPAGEPLGKGVLFTILIEDEIEFKEIFFTPFQARESKRAKITLEDLHNKLKQEVMLNGVLRSYKWSGVFSDYEITK
jgi:hypothetical protein